MTDPWTCDACGQPLRVGEYPFCPHGETTSMITRDEIPGGIVIENLGPQPVRVYSHSERRAIMKANGLHEQVRHVGARGSDKSPHTVRWV